MFIRLTIEQAAKSRGINTQKELIEYVKERTGYEFRAASMSDIYRNNKTAINREYLATIMQALDITDFNEVLTIIK